MRRCVANKNGMYRCKFKVTNLVKLEVPYGDKFRFCVNFMEQCPGKIAGIYRWPNPPDELWVSLSDILKRIPEPLPNGRSKRMFNIPETESVAIESKFGDWKTFKN
jgi:hypothetical protein